MKLLLRGNEKQLANGSRGWVVQGNQPLN